MRRTLVFLTFDEIDGLRALWDRVPVSSAGEILAVDAGSTDGTLEFYREKGVRTIVQDRPGRGEAFRIAAREASGEALCFFSPDGNEDPLDIPRLFDQLEQGYDLAIASRFLPGSRNEEEGRLLPMRALANRAFTLAARLAFGGRLTDAINGFRAIRTEALRTLAPDAEGFAIEYQISLRALKAGLRVAEIPTREGDRIGGRSRARSLPTGYKVMRVLLRELRAGRRAPPSA